ncbi:MAG: PQQ-dependent sugar dehydrogenase [Woeseia sp.]
MRFSGITGSLSGMALLSLLLGACGGAPTSGFIPPPLPPPPPPGVLTTDVQRVFGQISFASPVALMQAPGDNSRWFAVEQAGMIRVFANDPNVSTSSVFVDIRGRVDSNFGESGLLGMAFHPDFANNDQIFLSYTSTGVPLVSVISRFTVDTATGTLDATSEQPILTVPQEAGNHNGGNIVFGPDGFLYIGFGDGGGAGDPNERAQDTNYILGSMVRLDVDGGIPYAIPPTNPFSSNTNCVGGTGTMPCPEIYAWGFRNPWRFSFDSVTGELWVADVGQNSWEEVNRVDAGMNYGWDEREGAHCFEPPSACSTMNVDPITEYDHSVGNSVTGGYVYRGGAIPDLVGNYVFGDFGTGRIWAVAATATQGTTPTEIDDTALSISAFARGADGELYALDYGGGGIWQIISAP